MKFYLYIDESGGFEEKKRSIVLGCISDKSPAEIETALREAVANFPNHPPNPFVYPRDLHCLSLLFPDKDRRLPADLKACYKSIPFDQRQAFVDHMRSAACEFTLQIAVSSKPPSRVDWDSQAAYVANLVQLVWTTLSHIASGPAKDVAESVKVVIATRRGLGEHIARGESQLRRYVRHWCEDMARVERREDIAELMHNVHIQHAVGPSHPGLIAADLWASAWASSKKDLDQDLVEKAWRTSADEQLPTKLAKVMVRLFDEDSLHVTDWSSLFAFGLEFGAAGQWQQRRDALLNRLRATTDENVLGQQIPNLWQLAQRLLEHRTAQAGYLPAARAIYAALRDCTKRRLREDPDSRFAKTAALYLLDSIDGLIRCANHMGEIQEQEALRTEYEKLLGEHQALIGGYTAAERRRIELLNRFCNRAANDYRFVEMAEEITPHLQALRDQVPEGETDELLGKVLGTVGQSLAFRARIEPDLADEAKTHLEESLGHFATGTGYRSMTLNYLVALAWQNGDLAQACRWLSEQPDLAHVRAPQDLWQSIELLAREKYRIFDLVSALRILAAKAWSEPDTVQPEVLKRIDPASVPNEHPVHQLHKWLAILCLVAGQKDRADELAQRGIELANAVTDRPADERFTIHTIGASIWPIRCRAAGGVFMPVGLVQSLRQLAEASSGFATYLEHFDGPEGICSLATAEDHESFWTACSFLPFAYA